MKNQFIAFIVGFVLCFLLLKNCSNKTESITVPEKVIEYQTKTEIVEIPIEIPLEVPKFYKDTKTEKELKAFVEAQNERIKLYEEEVSYMVTDFHNSDSINKAKLYESSTKLSQFSQTWEDDQSILTVNGIVQGSVKEITPYLKVKEYKTTIPSKEKRFSISAGIGSDFQATTPVLKAGVGYQNYELDYLKINGVSYGTVTYRIKL
jgi:hypothetical protein